MCIILAHALTEDIDCEVKMVRIEVFIIYQVSFHDYSSALRLKTHIIITATYEIDRSCFFSL